MSDDPVFQAVEKFMEAVESRIARQDGEIRSLRDELQTRAAPALTIPEPIPGKDGIDGKDGKDGRDGVDGKDAVVDLEEIVRQVTEYAVPRVVALVPAPERGERGDAGLPGIPGKNGEPGENGLNAPEEIRAIAREEVLTQQRSFYQGVFREGTEYRTAQAVTWDGSLWFATKDTTSKPADNNRDWILAVKRGRDGRK